MVANHPTNSLRFSMLDENHIKCESDRDHKQSTRLTCKHNHLCFCTLIVEEELEDTKNP